MQDLETLEGKTIVELREIAKSLGITPSTMKKQELFEKIVEFATGAAAQSNSAEEVEVDVEPQPAPVVVADLAWRVSKLARHHAREIM